MADLTEADCDLILQSLDFTRQKFEGGYRWHVPDEVEFRRQRLADVQHAAHGVQAVRQALKRRAA